VRILVFSRVDLSRPSAHAVHNVHTSAALARAGASVTLHADLGGRPPEDTLAAYGAEPSGNLTLRDMGWRWHATALPIMAARLLRREGAEPSVVLLSEVRPFALTLAAAARRRGHRVAFEAHNAAGRLAHAAAGIVETAAPAGPAGAAPVTSKSPGPILTIGDAGAREGAPVHAPHAHDDVEEWPEPAPPPRSPDPKAVAAAEERAKLERAILAHASVLVAPQRRTLEAVRGMLRPGVPAHVVPNGTLLPPPSPPTEKDIEILYLGSLLPWKGVDALVAAMQLLYPHTLTIVGGRDEQDRRLLRQMALQLGVAARVTFLPPVPPSEVWGLYARAKVGAAPLSGAFLEAREYTFPMKLVEMMAAGLPIVAAKLPTVQEIVRDGEEALLATSDNPDAYGLAIRRLLEDHDLAARLAAAARRKAEEYTYARRAERLLAAFEGLAA
jgi:glycosyltransferase involved in cell wall biosynthesis